MSRAGLPRSNRPERSNTLKSNGAVPWFSITNAMAVPAACRVLAHHDLVEVRWTGDLVRANLVMDDEPWLWPVLLVRVIDQPSSDE